jgi:hypothetical protein
LTGVRSAADLSQQAAGADLIVWVASATQPARGPDRTRLDELRSQAKAGYQPAEEVRYNQRSSAERVNGNLKDNCGAHHLRVRGAPKVFCHLMFGVVVVSVEQIMRLVT